MTDASWLAEIAGPVLGTGGLALATKLGIEWLRLQRRRLDAETDRERRELEARGELLEHARLERDADRQARHALGASIAGLSAQVRTLTETIGELAAQLRDQHATLRAELQDSMERLESRQGSVS
jgi:predicted  nucleic acid-binding Zn-ribbon protein